MKLPLKQGLELRFFQKTINKQRKLAKTKRWSFLAFKHTGTYPDFILEGGWIKLIKIS